MLAVHDRLYATEDLSPTHPSVSTVTATAWKVYLNFSPAFDPASLTKEELIAYYSIRGFAVQDIRLLLRYIHGHAIRYLVVHTCMLLATNFLV